MRFKRCRWLSLVAADGRAIRAVIAERPSTRLLGLAGLDHAAAAPILLPRCRSIHTRGMRFALDVAFIALPERLEGAAVVLELLTDAGPRGSVSVPRSADRAIRPARLGVLELTAGSARARGVEPGIGLRLELERRGVSR